MAAPIYIIILFLTPGDAMIDSDENAISRSHFWGTFLIVSIMVIGKIRLPSHQTFIVLLILKLSFKMSKCQAEYPHFALSPPWEKNYNIYHDTGLAYSAFNLNFKGFCYTHHISTLYPRTFLFSMW